MGELEAVIALADLFQEVAVLVELEQARIGAAVIDEDVALGVGGDGDGLAEILAAGEFQEIRYRSVGDFRHVLGLRLLLGESGADAHDEREGRKRRETALHWYLPRESLMRPTPWWVSAGNLGQERGGLNPSAPGKCASSR